MGAMTSSHLPRPALCRMFAARKKPRYWRFSMDCTGTEAHVSSCKLGTQVTRDPVKNVTCENGLPAVVSCVPGQIFSPDGPSRFRKAYKPEVRMGQESGYWAPEVLGVVVAVKGTDRDPQKRGRRASPNSDPISGGQGQPHQ